MRTHKVKPPLELIKKMKALTHGGKRINAGRPKTTEPTKTIRVPVSLLPKIEQIIRKHKQKPFHG